jgi:Domain of unknown function (DUF397)
MPNYEATLSAFRKSSFSDSGNCVEVASENGSVMVRDSRLCDGEMIPFSSTVWRDFTQAIRLKASI